MQIQKIAALKQTLNSYQEKNEKNFENGNFMKEKLKKYKQMDGIIFGTFQEAKTGSDKVDSKNLSIKEKIISLE